MVIRMCRHVASEIDASAIKKLTASRDSNEHRGISVLGDPNGHHMLYPRSRHGALPLDVKHRNPFMTSFVRYFC